MQSEATIRGNGEKGKSRKKEHPETMAEQKESGRDDADVCFDFGRTFKKERPDGGKERGN